MIVLLTVGSGQLVSVSRGGNRFGFAGVKEAQVEAVKLGVNQLGRYGGGVLIGYGTGAIFNS